MESHRTCSVFQQPDVTTGVTCCRPGKVSRTPSAQGLLRAGHVGSLCIASTKTPDSRRKQVFNTNHVICTNILGSASLSSLLGMVGTLPKSEFPEDSPGPPSSRSVRRVVSGLWCKCFCMAPFSLGVLEVLFLFSQQTTLNHESVPALFLYMQ